MSFKKLLSILLILIVFAVALSACSLQSSTELENPSETTSIITKPTSPPGPVVYTRKDLEDAVTELAWSYFFKGDKLQYCSQDISILGKYYNGDYRLSEDAAPEEGTSDTSIYSVCSDYIYKVYYEALDYRLFDSPTSLGATTTAMWTFCENTALLRWFADGYTISAEEASYGVSTAKQVSLKELKAFLANWETNLRPGDVIVPQGHALLYIGNGRVLDCWGRKFNTSTGTEYRELNGGVHTLHTIEDIFITGTDPITKKAFHLTNAYTDQWFVIFRPLDALASADTDADPSNDICTLPEWQLPDDTQTRLQFPGLEIDRTVSITPYGTAVAGDSITYRIAITNNSTDPDHLLWRKLSDPNYQGQSYHSLPVTEVIPAGTQLLENTISHGGVLQSGKLCWNLNLAPGETAVLTYQLKVTAPVGNTITSGGGKVGNIASNTISNTVGAPPQEHIAAALSAFFATDQTLWETQYGIPKNAAGMDFAIAVYKNVLGIDLQLPDSAQLLQDLFSYQTVNSTNHSPLYPKKTQKSMFCLNDNNTTSAKQLLVSGYYGGRKVYLPDRGANINEFRQDYLQPGDILVFMNTNSGGKATETVVAVYTGGNTIAVASSSGQKQIADDGLLQKHLWSAFLHDVFFLLRPSQVK